MAWQVELVFEQGVLRPLEPLALAEHQRVLATITEVAALEEAAPSRTEELDWLAAHSNEYRGGWVALQGGVLLSHGFHARLVRDDARRKGSLRPLLVRVPEEADRPSAGWL